jgi:uncharacterized membrane protein YhfC
VRLYEWTDRAHGEAFAVLAAGLGAGMLEAFFLGIRSQATDKHLPAH